MLKNAPLKGISRLVESNCSGPGKLLNPLGRRRVVCDGLKVAFVFKGNVVYAM